MKKLFKIFKPCVYSEVYFVEASTLDAAIEKVESGTLECNGGENVTGKEGNGKTWGYEIAKDEE